MADCRLAASVEVQIIYSLTNEYYLLVSEARVQIVKPFETINICTCVLNDILAFRTSVQLSGGLRLVRGRVPYQSVVYMHVLVSHLRPASETRTTPN